MGSEGLIDDICEAVSSGEDQRLVREFSFGGGRNELLLFFKPECFLMDDIDASRRILEMSFGKFDEFFARQSGVLLLRGRRLEELGIMDRHYGFINRLSRNASHMVSEYQLVQMQEKLGVPDMRVFHIDGGHEFLEENPDYDPFTLDEEWAKKKSFKQRSGFYFQTYDIKGVKYLLVNGFHPAQLAHFTDPTHLIVVVLLQSDTGWAALKNELAGATFPEKAVPGSIRGHLYAHASEYGLKNVAVSANCVHLSAGPFEGLFEVRNFLSEIPGSGYALDKTGMYRKMTGAGLTEDDVNAALDNPVAKVEDRDVDLFTRTEEMDSEDAIGEFRETYLGR